MLTLTLLSNIASRHHMTVAKKLGVMSAGGDFRANFSLGGTVSPFPVDEDLAALALRASAVLELDMAGV